MSSCNFPVGWNGTSFIQPEHDPELHHIETWDVDNRIALAFYWNRAYCEHPIGEKDSYKGRHYWSWLSLEEAKAVRDALSEHIDNVEKKGIDKS